MRALNESKPGKQQQQIFSQPTEILSPLSLSLCLSLGAALGSTARLIVLTDGVSLRSLLYLATVAPLQLPLLTWQLANLNVVVDVVDNERRQF